MLEESTNLKTNLKTKLAVLIEPVRFPDPAIRLQGAPGTQMRTIAYPAAIWHIDGNVMRAVRAVPMNPISGMSHANTTIVVAK